MRFQNLPHTVMKNILDELHARNAAATMRAMPGAPHPDIARLVHEKMYAEILDQLVRAIRRRVEGETVFREGLWRATNAGELRLLVPKTYVPSWLGCMIGVYVSKTHISFSVFRCDDPSFAPFATQLHRDVQRYFPSLNVRPLKKYF